MKKLVLIAAAMIALTSMQAHAQSRHGGGGGGGAPANPADAERKSRMAKEEAAAKAAMQKVPDSKEKYDPWKIGK